jgi:sucrose-6-phosphate hydrolase SacC (GH32 family)
MYLLLLQGVPRTLTLDSKTGVNLIQWPIEEIESLRTNRVFQTDVNLDAGAVVEVKGVAGDQVNIQTEGIFIYHLHGQVHSKHCHSSCGN